jgi:putative transposase
MGTYTQIIYQIVFSTYSRENTLISERRPELNKYIWGILENKNCHPYQVNGVSDHLHIITHLHPMVSLASLVKDIKLGTSEWIKRNSVFPGFQGWQEGYGGFTYSYNQKDALIHYVKNQEVHHKMKTSREEFIDLLFEHGISFEEKFLW